MRSGALVVVGLLWVAAMARAEVCDDIGALADGWDQFAAALSEREQSGLTRAEAEEAERAFADGITRTRELSTFLLSQDGPPVVLGSDLEEALDWLEQAPDLESVVDAVDDVVDVLDEIVERCESEQPEAPEPARPAGRITVAYQAPPHEPGYAKLAQGLRESGVYEAIAGTVASAVALPADLPVDFAACGEPNAFYDPNQRRITMCYEFFGLFASVFADAELSDEAFAESVLGAGAFFFLHEIGHALVHLFEIPITGREEDSVDSLATLILLHGEGESALLAAIENFGAMADSLAGGDGALPFWDEHSLNEQRLYDVACLVFGSNPEQYAGMVGPDALPEERALRCPAEFQQKNQAWDTLLAPYFIE